ncbi:MAG: hypothetical protein AB199_00440 [Parcubacteria bacterium C7867-004]|nr:MAG: hypothetical protein AB199_00440 [Parcubacteria bacterium C7867-004]
MPAPKTTQSFVPVKEVRNGVVILKNDGYRGILMCSSINFALKGEDEQQGVVQGFQSFLNTLDFSVEIVIHSRKTDIRPYLALLESRAGTQTTELMKLQLREYEQFIRNFIDTNDIMTKMFYVIVPYAPSAGGEVASAISFLGRGGAKKSGSTGPEASFEEHRVQLEQRMALVVSGLGSSGVRAVPLGTEEIIELLYRSFNLSELENPIRLTNA